MRLNYHYKVARLDYPERRPLPNRAEGLEGVRGRLTSSGESDLSETARASRAQSCPASERVCVKDRERERVCASVCV